jgi:hypothetical protein
MNDKKLSQQLCDLREKLLEAENQRNSGAKTYSTKAVAMFCRNRLIFSILSHVKTDFLQLCEKRQKKVISFSIQLY